MTRNSPGILRPYSSTLDLLFRLADAVIVFFGLVVTFDIYGIGGKLLYNYYLLGAAAVIVFHIAANVLGLYGSRRIELRGEETKAIIKCWLLTIVLILAAGYATKTSSIFSRLAIGTWFLITPTLLILWKAAIRLALNHIRAVGGNTRTVAIIGTGPMAQRVAGIILDTPSAGLRLLGFYDDSKTKGTPVFPGQSFVVRGTIDDLIAEVKQHGKVDHVYVTLPLSESIRIADITTQLADSTASLYLIPDFMAVDLLHSRWTYFGDIPAIRVYETPFYGVDGTAKRLEDIVVSVVLLILFALPMLVIAATLRITAGPPVIFRQHRYGLDGQEIVVWKFRTMTVCEDGQVLQATVNDSRVTGLGRFLRRSSLDELPQLFNALGGEMSLVGPRPHAVAHNEEYRKLIHGYMLRHKVKPGITGLAQVRGLRGETETLEKMRKRVELDLDYIRNWSLWLDLRILVATPFRVASGENAR